MNHHQSDTIAKIAAALVKAQATMGVAVKDATNPHFKTKYADLASIINAAREPLADNGLAVIQRCHPNDRGVQLQTTIVHESGEWISDGGLFLPATKIEPQAFGSAITYSRRYAYAAMLGIVQDDDDGARAVAAQQAARVAADAPKLTHAQADTIVRLMGTIGHTPNLDGKLAEDYPAHVDAAIGYVVKQGGIDAGFADAVRTAALATDAEALDELLASTTEAVPA